jgi:mutator protein MutT
MKTVLVSAAVIERDGRILVTRRPPGVHLEGYWEFPGGKCGHGERLDRCLARELREELAADVIVGDEIFATTHDYDDRRIELHFLRCRLEGEVAPQLGQELKWIARSELDALQFPPADMELIRMLRTSKSEV